MESELPDGLLFSVGSALLLACAAVIAYDLSRRVRLRGDSRGLAAGSPDAASGLGPEVDEDDSTDRPELVSGRIPASTLRLRQTPRGRVIIERV